MESIAYASLKLSLICSLLIQGSDFILGVQDDPPFWGHFFLASNVVLYAGKYSIFFLLVIKTNKPEHSGLTALSY